VHEKCLENYYIFKKSSKTWSELLICPNVKIKDHKVYLPSNWEKLGKNEILECQ
jgi:serine protease inhibitor ecotin